MYVVWLCGLYSWDKRFFLIIHYNRIHCYNGITYQKKKKNLNLNLNCILIVSIQQFSIVINYIIFSWNRCLDLVFNDLESEICILTKRHSVCLSQTTHHTSQDTPISFKQVKFEFFICPTQLWCNFSKLLATWIGTIKRDRN